MGTTVEKATKTIQSISEIQQGINNLGGNLTDQTPLDEFRSELDDLYAKFPKTDYAEGSNITIENCLKGKLDFEDDKVGYGDMEQESTNGYQLLDNTKFVGGTRNGITTTINGTEIIANGSVAEGNNSQINLANPSDASSVMTLPAGTYTLSTNNPVAAAHQNTCVRLMLVENGATVSTVSGTSTNMNVVNATKTFTLNTQIDCIIQLRTDGGETLTNFKIKPMLESGSTAHEWEKYTGGIPSPNPSYPENIRVVTGEQEVVVRGKNIFDNTILAGYGNNYQTTIPTGKRINVITATTGTRFTSFAIMDLKKYVGKTIRMKANFQASGSNTGRYYIGLCDSNAGNRTALDTVSSSGNIASFIVPNLTEDKSYLCVTLYSNVSGNASADDYVEYTNIILTIDEEDMTYEPYITSITKQLSLGDIELAKIGDYRDYIYRTYGKNLWGGFTEYTGTSAQVTFTFKNDGSIYANGTATGGNANVSVSTLVTNGIYATLKPNTYNVSCANLITGVTLGIYDENANSLGTSFTLTQETKVIIRIRVATGTSVNDIFKIQLEKGLSATDYNPFGSGKWYKHSKVGKETLTGGDSENWVLSQSGTANWYYALQKAIGGDTAKTNQLKSNYYPYSSITSTTTGKGIWYSASYIRVRYGTEDTPSNYKTWLSTHNVLLYYILAEATDTEITDTTLINQLEDIYNIQSVNGTTIVEINGNLPMIIKCRALKAS